LELCYAPPFNSAKDPVNMAGFVAENVLEGKLRQFYPEDVATLPRDGSVTLLDVRTPGEYSRGMIEGFKNIPVDELRDRVEEIDREKPVYLHCKSGQRSYIAYRILTGLGYECYNLAGGYDRWSAITQG
jgi:rhodanese-related sulfurtransferase